MLFKRLSSLQIINDTFAFNDFVYKAIVKVRKIAKIIAGLFKNRTLLKSCCKSIFFFVSEADSNFFNEMFGFGVHLAFASIQVS